MVHEIGREVNSFQNFRRKYVPLKPYKQIVIDRLHILFVYLE